MKLTRVLLRWYKSFHLNYRGTLDKGETKSYRPWNKLSPSFVTNEEFPFIEIPIEDDITSVVGANESGKSHLLNAISKVILGTGIQPVDKFKQTDLCHYAGIRTRNVEAWPNIGVQFRFTGPDELSQLRKAIGIQSSGGAEKASPTFTLLLAPEPDEINGARVFIEPDDSGHILNDKQLKEVRKLLPAVQFIDSGAQLNSEIPLTRLLAAYGDDTYEGVSLTNRRSVEKVVSELRSLNIPPAQQPLADTFVSKLEDLKKIFSSNEDAPLTPFSLEMQLFKEILDIKLETVQFIYNLTTADRGYVEGQIAKWNEEINEKLNLSHFWKQDEQFRLFVNYKDGIVYFEIKDKTDSIYTFRERSSGLKYFLSYYIQAKAMELSNRNQNSIILMDEPDSALSILGQRNLLSVFESLVSPESSSETCQLVYTTHSPYLINRNFPRRIRVVKKEDAEEGTQFIEQARSRRYEPVRTALGIDSAPSLFLGEDNVLVEGATDQYLLTELIRVFATPANVGEFLDLNAVIFVSADGVSNIENVLEQSRWADEPIPPTALVVDSDPAADAVIKEIINPSSKKLLEKEFVLQIGDVVNGPGSGKTATCEDLIPISIYKEAVRAYIEHWLPETWSANAAGIRSDLEDPNYGERGLVESTKTVFEKYRPAFKTDFDKMGVLQEVISIVTSRHQKNIGDPEIVLLRKHIVQVCDFIRDALAKSRAATAKESATQRAKRIINDFERLNKQNVPITTLETLFKRLHSEVAPIGADGEHFLKVVNNSLAQLGNLRSAGQQRISGDLWVEWHTRIVGIKKNPLTATASAAAATPAAPVNAGGKSNPKPKAP
jgi:predicted ATPase